MIKKRALYLSIFLLFSFSEVRAQSETNQQFVDLNSQEYDVLSIIYSWTENRAIAVITFDKEQSKFKNTAIVECGINNSAVRKDSITITDLVNCQMQPERSFVLTENNATKFDLILPQILEKNMKRLAAVNHRDNSILRATVGFSTTLSQLSIYKLINKFFYHRKFYQAIFGPYLTKYLKVSVLGLFGISVFYIYDAFNPPNVPSLEKQFLDQYKSMVSDHPEVRNIPFQEDPKFSALTFDLIRSSLLQAIDQVNYDYEI